MCYNMLEVINMETLPNYYTTLFNAVTEALKAIEKWNYGMAWEILVQGQKDAEKQYIAEGEQ